MRDLESFIGLLILYQHEIMHARDDNVDIAIRIFGEINRGLGIADVC